MLLYITCFPVGPPTYLLTDPIRRLLYNPRRDLLNKTKKTQHASTVCGVAETLCPRYSN